MTDRSTGTSNDQTTSTDASDSSDGGEQRLEAPRESAAERTSVIIERLGGPLHSRPNRVPQTAEAEQAPPGGESARVIAGGAPPWYRGAAAGNGTHGGPPHTATGPPGPPLSDDSPAGEEPTYAFSSSPRNSFDDAPTSYFEPVAAPERESADREHDQGPVSAEQPMFEHTASAYRPSTRARTSRAPRRASLQLKRLDPWSVLKLSLVLSVAGFLAWMVAVGVLYGILEGMGVWEQLNGTYSDLTSVSDPESSGALISGGLVFGAAAVVGRSTWCSSPPWPPSARSSTTWLPTSWAASS